MLATIRIIDGDGNSIEQRVWDESGMGDGPYRIIHHPAAAEITHVSVAPTVSTSAYASGDVIGTKMTLASVARAADATGFIQQVAVSCKSNQTFAFDLLLFSANPVSTFTDNAALALNAADYDKLIGVVHITDWTSLGTPSFAQANNLAMPFQPATGTSTIYGVLVSRATPTLTSTSDIKVTIKASAN